MKPSKNDIVDIVTPAKAGAQFFNLDLKHPETWIPAFAGMTTPSGMTMPVTRVQTRIQRWRDRP